MFGHSHVHLQGGKSKNTATIRMCRYQSIHSLKIHSILFKVTVKTSILQIGVKILKLKGGCTRIIVLWMVYLIHSTIIHVQQPFNF
jgi:hypothetical protein